jgi:hypothetical protein
MKGLYASMMIGFLLVSCSNNSPDDLTDNQQITGQVTYEVNVAPIMAASCVSCHSGVGASGNLRLENYTQVREATENGALIDRMSRPASDPLVMPTSGPLPQTTIDIILAWETDGYLEN